MRNLSIAAMALIAGFTIAPSLLAQARPAAGKPTVAKLEKEEENEKEEKEEEEEKKESMSSLPAPVKAAFAKAYPKAVIKGVSSEKEDGKVLWEVESTDGGKQRDLMYQPDGKVLSVEEAIDASSMPAPVKDALAKAAPGATVTLAEHVTEGTTEKYEIHIKTAKGARELSFTAAGKPVN